MTEYGLTDSGFVRKPYSVIREELAQALIDGYGANFRTDDDDLPGVTVSALADGADEIWAQVEAVHSSGHPSGASGAALDDLMGLAALRRLDERFSTVTLQLGGTDGTVVTGGAQVEDDDGNVWAATADSPAFSGGTGAETTFQAVEAGPLRAEAGSTTWTLKTVIAGWNTATNAEDAEPGRLEQSNADARQALALGFHTGGGSSEETMRAIVARVEGVDEVLIIANRTASPDADGRPPKSFEVVVRGGDDQAIADAIWFSMPEGIESVGDIEMEVTDSQGDAQTVYLSRPTEVPIYMLWRYRAKPGAPTNLQELVRDELIDFGSTLGMGDAVNPWDFEQNVETRGMKEAGLYVSRDGAPSADVINADPIELTRKEIATFDEDDIAFEIVTTPPLS